MPHYERHFSLAEARALLPDLRRAFARIHTLLEEAQKSKGDAKRTVQFFSANGHGPRVEGAEEGGALQKIQEIVDEIHEKGVVVKDLRRGLCDFPFLLPPTYEEVFLCWELSEADIGYWHGIEDGYSGRVPLD